MNKNATQLLVAASIFAATGCSTLIGSVRPAEEKSDTYGVIDLSSDPTHEWAHLTDQQSGLNSEEAKNSDSRSTEVADSAYQNKKTSAIISINSACRIQSPDHEDLHEDSKLLFLGISDITLREEVPMVIQATPALRTTLEGKLQTEPVKLRAVVLRRKACLYDLLYVARPEHFPANEADFERFVASLRLK